MKIVLSEKNELPGVPSGSGIIKFNDYYFAIGDDSQYLFKLNSLFEITEKIPLTAIDNFADHKISKPKKADYESIEKISDIEFVIFGSGSKSPQRDMFFRVLIQNTIEIEKYSTTKFYTEIKSLNIFAESELNIEAVAYRNGHIFLFNRKKNIVLNYIYDELLNYLKGVSQCPEPIITRFTLPEIDGIEAGFSGATAFQKQSKIIFTASVENTGNAYDDGEILGSYIGIIDLIDDNVSKNIRYVLIPETERYLKVESVTIDEETGEYEVKVVLITDDDKGNSEILKGVLSW